MSTRRRWLQPSILIVALAAFPTFAQVESGKVFVRAENDLGEPLSGVNLTLSGVGSPQVQVTGASGRARFLNLSPGTYALSVELEGFATTQVRQVDVRVGHNNEVEVELLAAVRETIAVTTESPLLDQRRIVQGTTVTGLELEKVPTARDPWAFVEQTPGVLMDRVNVGGSESGQQALFVGTGSRANQNVFLLDGVNITDMTTLGGSATYFGFGQMEEMQFATGGTDVETLTPGVHVNMVTKRGTNLWRGSGRFLITDGDWQSGTGFDQDDLGPGQAPIERLDQVDGVEDYGAEAGGPLIGDRLWIWGSYDRNLIDTSVVGGLEDDTDLLNTALKANVQVAANNSAVASWSEGDKKKFGRDAGPTCSRECSSDQTGPAQIVKLEDSHIFSANLFLTGSFSDVASGFALEPKGGRDARPYIDADGVTRGTNLAYLDTDRSSQEWRLDSSSFFSTGGLSHELKFGGSYRVAENDSLFGVTGNKVYSYAGENFGLPSSLGIATVWRDRHVRQENTYIGIWVQDTLTWEKLTIIGGLRYDLQEGENLASTAAGPELDHPDVLLKGDLVFGGNDPGFEWENVSPRLGATYALGEQGNTLLRGSLSRFVDQLGTIPIEHINPVGFVLGVYLFHDANGNIHFDETDPVLVNIGSVGFDPDDLTSVASPHAVDPDFTSKTTDELLLGVEHAWRPDLVTGLTLTYRRMDNIAQLIPFVETPEGRRLQRREDFEQVGTVTGTLPDGRPYSRPVLGLKEGIVPTGGELLTTGGRQQQYLGASLDFTKRLADHWMLRGHFTWTDWTWDVSDEFLQFDDPTDQVVLSDGLEDTADDDGDVVAEQSGGSADKDDIFLNSEWSFHLGGLYQVAPAAPWGFNVGFNVIGRQGFPIPLFDGQTVPGEGNKGVQVTRRTDSFRYDDLYNLDLRVDKGFSARGLDLTLSLDVFNVTNEGTVLQRSRGLDSSRPFFVDEVLSPRIFRAGVTVGFR